MLDNTGEKFKNGILLEFAKTVELFGLSPIESRVFTILYVEGKPLTLDEMSEALGKSKTSMSTSIRSLVELNLVKRVWKKGVRKDLFQANTQLYKHFMSFYLKKWLDETEVRKEALAEIKNQTDQLASGEVDENLQNKLNNLLDFHNKLTDFFKEASKTKNDGS
ncbi:GbsR/MarR family transcriptional regulator [Ornithinibacillus californiensis]|uniref:GbsR/MarR family transcriptional regulator n=1 Tax=Ornithinibacillus californiensis TaxID=161536 RepID=UPI00064D7DE3|nr:MarR family transcriptional regulator [Ornithinibacillus californiensis]